MERNKIVVGEPSAEQRGHNWAIKKDDSEWLISDGFGIIGAVADPGDAQLIIAAVNSHSALLEAAKQLFDLINAGVLVRDISHDADPKWYLKAIELTQVLIEMQAAIKQAEQQQKGS